jgi:hypothetical protein
VAGAAEESAVNATLAGAIIAALAAGYSAFLTYRNSKRATDIAERKVGQEEYDAQQARYSRLLDDQQKLLDRMQSQVDRLATQLAQEQTANDGLRGMVRELQQQLVEMQTKHVQMLKELGYDLRGVPAAKN